MPTIHENELVSSLSELFGSSKYSDLTVRCGSDLYKVHRAILCQRSKFFAAACDSGFKEAITATIILDDDDQSTVRRMLTYLYTLDYDDGGAPQAMAVAVSKNTDGRVPNSNSKPDVVDDARAPHCQRMNNVRVYALAEKYNIPALKDLAKTKFSNSQGTHRCVHYREVINAIFESTPDTDSGLRNIAIRNCSKAMNVEKCLEEEVLAPVFRHHGNLGLGVLREVVMRHKWELEKQKKDSKSRMIKLRLALGSLHDDAMHLHIPGKEDSQEEFERSRQALGRLQQRLLNVRDSVKLED